MTANDDELQRVTSHLAELGVQFRIGKSGKVRAASVPADIALSSDAWQRLCQLPHLARLEAAGCADVSDQHAQWISSLPQLAQLDLSHTSITDACIPALERMQQLQLLNLTGTGISRDALAGLRKRMLNTRIVHLTA
ncbi:MAG: hypothetical protein KDB14_13340 [Planctomycetales bacterium]|nr:hypothetical protein [Planctomycetales bacterium]